MEGVLVLAALARRWRFELVPGEDIGIWTTLTWRPRPDIRAIARRRSDAPAVAE